MQFNWGTGIALFYTLFASTMILMVIKSTGYDHSLVQKDYYQADLAYQQHFDKLTNTQAKPMVIEHTAGEQEVRLRLIDPELKNVEGEVWLFRPSNDKFDHKQAIQLDADGLQRIATDDLIPGLWRIKVDWTANGQAYYTEADVVL